MRVKLRALRTEEEYDAALTEMAALMTVEEDGEQADRLELLAILVQDYERQKYPMRALDPIEAIESMMRERGLTRAALEPIIGSRGRVSEVMNRRRRLTLDMIHRLHERLGIPREILARPYRVTAAARQTGAAA